MSFYSKKRNGPLDFKEETLDGKKYFVVSWKIGALANMHSKVWFDPARKFIPVREQFIRKAWFDPERGYLNIPDKQDSKFIEKDMQTGQWDIQYTHDEKYGLIPISWKSSWWGDSKELLSVRQIKVTDWHINPTVPAETFDLKLPSGTYVYDKTNNTEYILRANGTKRLVTRQEGERGATYESLLNSDPGKN